MLTKPFARKDQKTQESQDVDRVLNTHRPKDNTYLRNDVEHKFINNPKILKPPLGKTVQWKPSEPLF